MTTSELAVKYVRDRLARREIEPVTASTLRANLRLFAESIGDPPIRQLTREHIEEWLTGPASALARSTVRTRFSQVRTFCRWAVERGYMRRDPTLGLRAPRQPEEVPRNLRLADVRRLLDACGDVRDELIVSLMVQEGLRRKEVAGLQLGEMELDTRLMKVRGKGGHERVLWITDETLEVLEMYLVEHPALAGPLIRSKIDGRSPLAPVTVGRLVSDLMRRAGVKRFPYDGRSAHALRHTCATDMVRGGAHLRDVQQVMGHRSLRATERYLAWEIRGKQAAMKGRRYRRRPAAGTVVA